MPRYSPTITHWNRLEGRPRTEDFDRALRAEVRDALWMLSKQWQMGEFKGDDAGSTILGGDTIIGEGSIIGGNTWITDSVPAGSKIYYKEEA